MNMIAELVLTVVCLIATVLIPLVSLSIVKGCSWTWPWTSCSWTCSTPWRLPFSTDFLLQDSAIAIGKLLSFFNGHKERILSELASDTCPSADQEQQPSELNEEDLMALVSRIEETDGGPPWILIKEQSMPSLTYKAWYREPQIGPPQYRTKTVFENVSPEILRDFFWDDEFRPRWDKMLIHCKVLSACLQTGTMIVHCIRKLPLFCSAREYVIIRRIWESASGYYCVTKTRKCFNIFGSHVNMLGNALSSFAKDEKTETGRCLPFKLVHQASNADQQTGSEVLLFHSEEIGLPKEVVKMGVRAGMWNMVKKLHLGVQMYIMEKTSDESPSYYAIMAHITTKLPASPSTIMFHIPEAVADENACQNQPEQETETS